MAANYQNWRSLAAVLNERLRELGDDGRRALGDAGLPSRTYITFLLTGRAQLKLRYVKPLARALQLDEDELFRTALEGMHEVQDLVYLRPFLDRLGAHRAEGKGKTKKKKMKHRKK